MAAPGAAAAPVDPRAVAAALSAFHDTSTSAQRRSEADNFLKEFRKRPEAWQVADALIPARLDSDAALHSASYGAGTLLEKVRSQFSQLPVAAHDGLRQRLLGHITNLNGVVQARIAAAEKGRIAQGGMPLTILKQLCAAYVDFVIQKPDAKPNTVIAELCASFKPPEGSLVLLEVLAAFPIEAFDKRGALLGLSSERRNQFLDALEACAASVLSLLTAALAAAATGNNVTVIARVFECFTQWVDTCRIDPAILAASPLLHHCFAAVAQFPMLVQVAGKAIQSVIYHYPNAYRDEAVVIIVLQKMLTLESAFDAAVARNDEDACLTVSRVFADAAVEYHKFLFFDVPAEANFKQLDSLRGSLFTVLTKCAASPFDDVSSATFRIWNQVRRGLEDLDEMSKDSRSDGKEGRWLNHLRGSMQQHALTLARTMLARLRFPPEKEWAALPTDKQDDFKHKYRYDVADTLLMCAQLAGGSRVLEAYGGELQRELQAWQAAHAADPSKGWEGTEACLYAIRCIARHVPVAEEGTLGHVIALLPRLPPVTEVRASSFRLIARYADWITAHPASLPGVWKMVLEGGLKSGAATLLASPVLECASACVFQLVLSSPVQLREHVLGLLTQVNMPVMQWKNAGRLYRSLGISVCLLPRDHDKAMMSVVGPVVTRINAFNNEPQAAFRAAATDGLLANALLNQDGTVRKDEVRHFGLDLGTVQRLAREAAVKKGDLTAAVSAFKPREACAACVSTLLEHMVSFIESLSLKRDELLKAAGVAPSDAAAAKAVVDSVRTSVGAAAKGMLSAAWPVFMKSVQMYSGCPANLLRAVADVWMGSIRSLGDVAVDMLPSMLDMLVKAFSAEPNEGTLITLMRVIDHAYDLRVLKAAAVDAALLPACMTIVGVAFKYLGSPAPGDKRMQRLETEPDVVSQLFILLRRLVLRYPEQCMENTGFYNAAVALAVAACAHNHRTSLHEIMMFIANLPKAATHARDRRFDSFQSAAVLAAHHETAGKLMAATARCLTPLAPQLIKVILRAVVASSVHPASAAEALHELAMFNADMVRENVTALLPDPTLFPGLTREAATRVVKNLFPPPPPSPSGSSAARLPAAATAPVLPHHVVYENVCINLRLAIQRDDLSYLERPDVPPPDWEDKDSGEDADDSGSEGEGGEHE